MEVIQKREKTHTQTGKNSTFVLLNNISNFEIKYITRHDKIVLVAIEANEKIIHLWG